MFCSTNLGIPLPSIVDDDRNIWNCLDIIDSRRTPPQTYLCRERRFNSRITALSFDGVHKRWFFTADVCTRSLVDVHLSRKFSSKNFFADKSICVRIVNRFLQHLDPLTIFAADINICCRYAHSIAGNERSFDEQMRIVFEDLTVFKRTGFGFIPIDTQIFRLIGILRHEWPLQSSGKTSTAATTQIWSLHLIDYFFRFHF